MKCRRRRYKGPAAPTGETTFTGESLIPCMRATPRSTGGVRASANNPDRVSIRNLQVPSAVRPNEQVPWSFELENRIDANFLDSDWCQVFEGTTVASGVRFRFTISFAGEQNIIEGECVPDEGGSEKFSGQFFAPVTPGTYTFSVVAEGNNTGNVLAEETRDVLVEQDAPRGDCPSGFERDPDTGRCVPSDGGDGDGGNGGGDDGNGGGIPSIPDLFGGNIQSTLLLLVVLFGLIQVSGE